MIFIPIMGGTLTKEEKIVRALTISNNYSVKKKEDIQSMLYTFALKFLDSSQLGKVKEVIMMAQKRGIDHLGLWILISMVLNEKEHGCNQSDS